MAAFVYVIPVGSKDGSAPPDDFNKAREAAKQLALSLGAEFGEVMGMVTCPGEGLASWIGMGKIAHDDVFGLASEGSISANRPGIPDDAQWGGGAWEVWGDGDPIVVAAACRAYRLLHWRGTIGVGMLYIQG